MSPSRKTLITSGLIFSIGTLLGRFSGFFREIVLAKIVGASAQADIAVLILTLPDLMINFLVGGAMAAAFIPHIYDIPKELRLRFFFKLSGIILLVSVGVTALGFLLSSPLTTLLAPGLEDYHHSMAATMIKFTFLAVPFVALASVTRCFLQSENRFGLLSIENLIYNIVIIIGLVIFANEFSEGSPGLVSLTAVVVFGAVLRWFPQSSQVILVLRKQQEKQKSAPDQIRVPKEVWRRYFEALGAGLIFISLPYAARSFGSFSGEGAIAIFNYSFKLVELPVGIGVMAFSVILFPRVAQAFKEAPDQAQALARSGTRGLLVISIPVALCLGWWLLGLKPKSFVSFGALTATGIYDISVLAAIGLLALPARGIWQLNMAVMNAKMDTKTPLYISGLAVLLCLPGVLWAQILFGLTGVFAAMVATYYGIMFAGLWAMNKRHSIQLIDKSTLISAGLTLATTAVTLTIVTILATTFRESHIVSHWILIQVIRFLLAVIAGLIPLLVGILSIREYRQKLFHRP